MGRHLYRFYRLPVIFYLTMAYFIQQFCYGYSPYLALAFFR